MKGKRKTFGFGTVVASSLIVSLLALSGCNKTSPTDATNAAASAASAASAPQPASAASPYTPPTADQLEQMVAPIALFPDKLVAQVLAGSTYPDQITAANQWLAQNPSLKGDALQNAANQQPWDPSVKSLTAFPAVLSQMAGNIQWTTALGEAYVNDPNDVMNAIQVMRQRAQQNGNLKTSKQMAVSTVARATPAPQVYTNEGDEPPVYAGPAVIAPPPQTIVIEPTQPDVVYVPAYNPAVVYGAPVPVYPGYAYSAPAYSTGEIVTAGVISFGIGIIVGSAISHHHDWGWHSWGMNWGGGGNGYGNGGGGGWHRPAVVYNNTTYVSKSTTVVNHITNVTNINNTHVTNNYGSTNSNFVRNNTENNNQARPNFGPAQTNAAHVQEQAHPGAPMSVPHFTQNDMRQGARPAPAPALEGQRSGDLPRPGVSRENLVEGQHPAIGAPSPERNEQVHQEQAAREAQMHAAQQPQGENAAIAQQRQEQQRQEQQRQEQQTQEQQRQQQQRQQQAAAEQHSEAQQHAAQMNQAREAQHTQEAQHAQEPPRPNVQPHPQPRPQPQHEHSNGNRDEHPR